MNIYENVKEIADHKGISIKKLEELAGLSNGSIGGWRKSSPTIQSLKKVSEALKVDITRLLK